MRIGRMTVALWASVMVTAAPASSAGGPRFDRVAGTARGGSENGPDGVVKCVYFPDLMIRQPNSTTPSPGPSNLVAIAKRARRPACGASVPQGAIPLANEGYDFTGRVGPFLLFTLADPNGAVPFEIVDASTGRVLLTDSVDQTATLDAMTVVGDHLRLRFRRARNAACSIVRDGAACWSDIVAKGWMPGEVAALPPPLDACRAAYAATKPPVPADDPSLISVPVELSIDRDGKAEVSGHGPIACTFTP